MYQLPYIYTYNRGESISHPPMILAVTCSGSGGHLFFQLLKLDKNLSNFVAGAEYRKIPYTVWCRGQII